MTSTTNDNHGDDEDETFALLLPWYVNGTLSPDERARLEAHAERSPAFAQQLAAETSLRNAVRFPPADTDAGWEKLRAQIEPEQGHPSGIVQTLPVHQQQSRPSGFRWNAREPWAMAAQVLLLVACAATLFTVVSRDDFVLLGRNAPAHSPDGNVLIMFQPATTQAATQAVLRENGVQIVRGPTDTGAYVAAVDTANRPQILSRLRRHSSVMMAEAIDQSRAQ